jgi:hypothetical protein
MKILYANVYISFISGLFQIWNPANSNKQLIGQIACRLTAGDGDPMRGTVSSIPEAKTPDQEKTPSAQTRRPMGVN